MKLLSLSAIAFLLVFCGLCELGFSSDDQIIKMTLNGIEGLNEASENNLRVESLARFAVQEHNKQQNSLLEFTRVVKAREQVVAGRLFHLTLEAIDAGKKKIYEAKVWVKPWMNFKQLEEFKLAHDCFTPSDLGVKQEVHGTDWKVVPVHVTEVQDAANHVVQSLQEKSNSLSPYKLQGIVLAKAKVIEDYVKFQLLLKVKRGIKEEMFRAEVHKNIGGKFYTSHIVQDHS